VYDGRASVLLRQRCDMLCTSGLVDGLASSQQVLRQFAVTTLELLSHVNMFDENALNRVTETI